MLEWFRPGEHDRVDRVLDDLKTLGVQELRTGIAWADAWTPEGEAWYAWLFPQLARRVNVLPCFVDTAPGWGVGRKTSAPPGNLKSYADFLDVLITRFGKWFEWIELWNEPNDVRNWDAELDPYWFKFSEMIGNAAHWAQHRGKTDGARRDAADRPELAQADGRARAAAAHRRGRRPRVPRHHREPVGRLGRRRPAACARCSASSTPTARSGSPRPATPPGGTTSGGSSRRSWTRSNAPVERVYWYALHDLDPRLPTGDGFHCDERDYHFGLKRADGGEKLLYRLWAEGGIDAVRDAYWLGKGVHAAGRRPARS